jgi:prepilin-type processing-associated H-X9-DG protein
VLQHHHRPAAAEPAGHRRLANLAELQHPLSSSHSGGVNVLRGDGSVSFIQNSIPLLTLQNLADRDDGNTVAE